MPVLSIERRRALAFRQRATHLDERLTPARLRDASFAGLQDSAPRSAVLALHARVRDVAPSTWEDPRLVQVWGPRGAVYVVAREDVAVFTLGLLPRDTARIAAIESAAKTVAERLRGRETREPDARHAQRHASPADLRAASAMGVVRVRWDGARISWWTVDPPSEDPEYARLELARRFLRSLGPSDPKGFAWWSGGTLPDARHTFLSLRDELLEVELGNLRCWVLKEDRLALEDAALAPTVRLLPPGDPYLGAADRNLLVPEARLRADLWPRSVWPGALLAYGELVGTWRRQGGRVTVRAWRRLTAEIREGIKSEVLAMPIESPRREVRWISS